MTQPTRSGRGAELTLSEAAIATGVSRSTIKRHLPDFEHRWQDERGSWLVPVQDLLGAGFKLQPRSADEANSEVTLPADLGQSAVDLASIQAKMLRLTEELATERIARAAAEATVSAYRDNLIDLRRQVNAITGPPAATTMENITPMPMENTTSVPAQPITPMSTVRSPEPPRRRWWSRSR